MRLIDADKLMKAIKRMYCTDCNSYDGVRCRACSTGDALDMIEDAPTVDAEPVWISVKDRLPEYYKAVLVIVRNNGALFTIIAYLTIGGIWVHKGFGRVIGVVHHWMPLPEPPKEDKHADD